MVGLEDGRADVVGHTGFAHEVLEQVAGGGEFRGVVHRQQGRVQRGPQVVAGSPALHGGEVGVGGDDEAGRHGQARAGEFPEVRPLAARYRGVVLAEGVEADDVVGHVISSAGGLPFGVRVANGESEALVADTEVPCPVIW